MHIIWLPELSLNSFVLVLQSNFNSVGYLCIRKSRIATGVILIWSPAVQQNLSNWDSSWKSSSEITGYFRKIEEADKGLWLLSFPPWLEAWKFSPSLFMRVLAACTFTHTQKCAYQCKQYLQSSIIHRAQHWYLFCCCFMHGWALCKFE